jgi:hypothetical protein
MAKKTPNKSGITAAQKIDYWFAIADYLKWTLVMSSILGGAYYGNYMGTHLKADRAKAVENSPLLAYVERKAVRFDGDIPMTFLKVRYEPVILLNTKISKEVPRWTTEHIASMLATNDISGVYRSNTSAMFGTYYDTNRPMHTLPTVHNSILYEDNIRLNRKDLLEVFPLQKLATLSSWTPTAPYHLLATALSDIHPDLEGSLDLAELISLNPSRSSVNIWLASAGSVTPCHYDGYYNM